jgi:O-antigen ligase
MSAATAPQAATGGDAHLAWIAVAACGMGTAALLFGIAAMSLPLAGAGGALLGAGATIVLAGGWLPPLVVLAAVLPLPALFSNDALRISPALVVTGALLVAFAVRTGAAPPHSGRATPLVPLAPVIALCAALGVAALFSEAPARSLREMVDWVLALGLLFVACVDLSVSRDRRRALARAIGVIGAMSGGLALLQAAGLFPSSFPIRGTPFFRATLGFGWPNELGMFLALSLPFAVYVLVAARSPGARALAWAGVFAVGFGLLATFSRASWLAVLLAPAVLLFTGARRLAVRIWMIALVFIVFADIVSGGAVQDRLAATIGDWVVEQRAALMLAGLVMFMARPIVGIGPGGFEGGLEHYGPQISWLWDYLPTAQNGYIQMAAETGLVGLGALVFFLGAVLRRLLVSARHVGATDDAALRTTVAWAFTTAILLAFNEWIFAHGVVQLIMLTAALGLAEASAARNAREAA